MSEDLGHKATQGAIWATIDRFSSMALQFAVNLVLARLLLPADFGAIGMLAIFITVSQTLIDGGFASALIQKKEPTHTDYSTIFYWNMAFSTFLYLILFAAAPLVGDFFHMPVLSSVLRATGLSLIINGVVSIQQTRLRKALAFRTLAITNLGSYIVSSAIGILLAYNGFGVWSLVAMQLLYGLFSVSILRILTHWGPSLTFSRATMRELFSFGGFILAANVLQSICQNLQGVIIGRKFNDTQMGYYSQAYKLDQVTSYSLPQVIVQVMYPVYSSIQDDRERLSEMVLMNIRVISLIVFPTLACLILGADRIISFLYGDVWLPSAPYFRILCVGGLFVCLQNVNFYAVAAVGKSRALFNWSIYKWGFLLLALLAGMNFGMHGLLWAMVLSSFNIFLTNAFLAHRYVGVHIVKELRAMGSVLLVTMASLGLGLALVSCLGLHIIIALGAQIALYLLLVYLFQRKAAGELLTLMSRLRKRQ